MLCLPLKVIFYDNFHRLGIENIIWLIVIMDYFMLNWNWNLGKINSNVAKLIPMCHLNEWFSLDAGMTDTGYQCWGGYYCPSGVAVPNPTLYICPRGMHCPNGSEIYKVCDIVL